MARLNQVLAVEKGVKASVNRRWTDSYHVLQKSVLLSGIARSYEPRDDEGDPLPPESTRVQVKAADELGRTAAELSRLFDVVATKDATNCVAKADVEIDGNPVLRDVPATTLLFLEKQLVDLHTYIGKMPVLDPADEGGFNDAANCYATPPTRTVRTKKVPRNHVVAHPTDKHPAQVQVYHEDVPVGDWTTVKLSGALPASVVARYLERVETLQRAVKQAREAANMAEIVDQQIGDSVFAYLLEGATSPSVERGGSSG